MSLLKQHLVVIMARGDSRRMGVPKGLCRLGPDALPFVAQLSGLYADLGFPVLVVVRQEDELSYRDCLEDFQVETLSAPGGAGTAQTMRLALDWAASRKLEEVCFWAHPVDLPLVRPHTIRQLLAAFEKDTSNALRPWHHGIPGHPVLFPGPTLARVLAGDCASLTMAAAWEMAISKAVALPVQNFETDDQGIVADFDHPEQLSSFRQTKDQDHD